MKLFNGLALFAVGAMAAPVANMEYDTIVNRETMDNNPYTTTDADLAHRPRFGGWTFVPPVRRSLMDDNNPYTTTDADLAHRPRFGGWTFVPPVRRSLMDDDNPYTTTDADLAHRPRFGGWTWIPPFHG